MKGYLFSVCLSMIALAGCTTTQPQSNSYHTDTTGTVTTTCDQNKVNSDSLKSAISASSGIIQQLTVRNECNTDIMINNTTVYEKDLSLTGDDSVIKNNGQYTVYSLVTDNYDMPVTDNIPLIVYDNSKGTNTILGMHDGIPYIKYLDGSGYLLTQDLGYSADQSISLFLYDLNKKQTIATFIKPFYDCGNQGFIRPTGKLVYHNFDQTQCGFDTDGIDIATELKNKGQITRETPKESTVLGQGTGIFILSPSDIVTSYQTDTILFSIGSTKYKVKDNTLSIVQ